MITQSKWLSVVIASLIWIGGACTGFALCTILGGC